MDSRSGERVEVFFSLDREYILEGFGIRPEKSFSSERFWSDEDFAWSVPSLVHGTS